MQQPDMFGYTFDELTQLVVKWGENRGLFIDPRPEIQILKTLEEIGELTSNTLKERYHLINDDLGDILVTLILYREMMVRNKRSVAPLQTCLQFAYNEIKDRKGTTVNGAFVKEE